MFQGLRGLGGTSDSVCLCIDEPTSQLSSGHIILKEDLRDPRTTQIFSKYKSSKDRIRWALKPILISHLLEQYDKVIYVDNDIAFFGSATFLFDNLAKHDILLTPHHYPRDPKKNQNWLEANFKVGLYNAGFIGVNKNAKHVMDWWADCCLYRCEKSLIRGLFDDQKYLDLVPLMHPNTKVLEHKGCNVAGWNVDVCTRVEQPDGGVLIDNHWPIVFIHFNGFSVRSILQGQDPLLSPHLDKYVEALRAFRPALELDELWRENTLWDQIKLWAWKALDRFK